MKPTTKAVFLLFLISSSTIKDAVSISLPIIPIKIGTNNNVDDLLEMKNAAELIKITENNVSKAAETHIQKREPLFDPDFITSPAKDAGDAVKGAVSPISISKPSLPSLPSMPSMPSISKYIPSVSSITDRVKSLTSLVNTDSLWKLFHIMKVIIKISSYFIPGLSQVKQAMLAVELARLAMKVASMYNEGDSFSSIGSTIVKGVGKAILRRRSVETNYIEDELNEDVDAPAFLKLIKGAELPKLSVENEELLKKEISSIIDSVQIDFVSEKQKKYFSKTMLNTVKFLATGLASTNIL